MNDVKHGDRPITAEKVGVIGLGMIGGGVAVSLARRGRVPAVYDVRPGVSEALEGVPAQLGSPAEVAEASDVVLVAVVDAEQARAVIAGPGGVLERARPGLVVVMLATVALPVVRELAQTCAASGVGLLDCGVTPGDQAANNGMVAILGGPDDVVAYAMPVLEDVAKAVVHCGPLGAGMATKIARNVVTYGGWRAVYEAARLAEAAQVAPEKLITVIQEADPDGRTLLMLLRLGISGVTFPEEQASSGERLMLKDLAAAQELAAEYGIPVPLVDTTREHGHAIFFSELRPAS